MFLFVGSPGIFCPFARIHAAVHPRVYLAKRTYRHIKRIAAKFKMIQRICEQLLLICYRVLLPFALQIARSPRLHVRVKPAGGAKSGKQKAER